MTLNRVWVTVRKHWSLMFDGENVAHHLSDANYEVVLMEIAIGHESRDTD